jgi:uncharacterized protein with von Willebrand factor type A (vWA) domain
MSALRSRYASLDALPRRLFAPIVTHLHGDLEDRARSVVCLRRGLLRGELPRERLVWPTEVLSEVLLDSLGRSGIVELCRGEPDLTDEVIATILDAVTGAESLCFSASAHFAGLAIAELRRRQQVWSSCSTSTCGSGADGAGGSQRLPDIAPAARDEIVAEARRIAVDIAAAKIRSEVSCWRERAEAIVQLREMIVLLAPKRGWDLSRGILRALSAKSATSAYDLVRHLQRLKDLVLYLGRLRDPSGASDETIFERISGPMRRTLPRLVPQRSDELRGPEVRDLDRSGDFGRMLPCEAVWLMHPALKRVWNARRAENALLVYRAEDDAHVFRVGEQEVADGGDIETTRRIRGPVIVCLDTSGSMAGPAGALAKAVVLHLTMTAHDEERPVYLYAFSGPGDVVEHELSFDGDGAEALLAFLVLDYAGGTDVAEPMRRALERHDQARWSRADLLLVSDGEFAAPRELVAALATRRAENDLRVHGLLLGDSSAAMSALCTTVHRFRDWVTADGDRA